ncbi:MAG: DUF6101 family protein [Methyloligellaceae bacterium]
MKRQTSMQGVVSLWKPACLDISPFDLFSSFKLPRSGFINGRLKVHDQVLISSQSILLRRVVLGKVVSQKRLLLSEFQGIALRISTYGSGEGLYYAVSINLHHDTERYCVPLYITNDLDFTSARLQAWSRRLRMPILLPAPEGGWKEASEPIGRLIMKPAFQRNPRQMLASRKAILPAYRETCQLDLSKRVSGREISAWD